MEQNAAISAFSALGQSGRLSVFRLLMRHVSHGVRPGDIAAALDMRPNTLSTNLRLLEDPVLIWSWRDGRAILYCVHLPSAGALAAYLVDDIGRISCGRHRPRQAGYVRISFTSQALQP
jgi:ArsR family transcriptional regulator, arsenate/arsenite/antimonite-responsive transcriptional repressor / arsenate reductase (thioredoxin)